MLSVILGILGILALAVFVHGFVSKGSELKQVWASLYERYGVSNSDLPVRIGEAGLLGELHLLDQAYVGRFEVIHAGIVFRRQFLKRSERILIPAERIGNLAESSDKRNATFGLKRDSGLPANVSISWSPELSEKWAQTQM